MSGRSMALVRPPTLLGHEPGAERHPTWLELFFDLVFVAAVAAVAADLFRDPTWSGLTRFALLFVPVWWAWMGYTWYASAFDSDDVILRLAYLGAMLAIVALAAGVQGVHEGHAALFAGAYAALQAILALLFLRARRHAGAWRLFATRYAAGDAIGALIWLASLAVPAPATYLLWAVGMAVLMATPPYAVMGYAGKAFDAAHIAERYGLFTLIVLGESIVAVSAALEGLGSDAAALAVAVLGFGLAAALWWLYFASVRWGALTRDNLLRSFTYGYGHLLVFGGIAATAVGVHLAADAAGAGRSLDAAEGAIVAGGLAAVLAAIGVIHAVTLARPDQVLGVRLAQAALVLAVGAAAPRLPAAVVIGLLFLVVAAGTAHQVVVLGDASVEGEADGGAEAA